jgi:hypothetical protein
MKIALFLSGHIRTLFFQFHKNLEVIKKNIGDCDIDVYYSFWDDASRSKKINDPWHIKVNDDIHYELKEQFINQYFVNIGANYSTGEIEEYQKLNNLSSQYYKTCRVVEQYMNDDYDFYIKIRPDIIINNFLTKEQIVDITKNKLLVVNRFYWYNEPYVGKECNEMIWASGKDIFRETNQLFLHENKILNHLTILGETYFGELATGTYFNSLLENNIIKTIVSFDFGYRVIR